MHVLHYKSTRKGRMCITCVIDAKIYTSNWFTRWPFTHAFWYFFCIGIRNKLQYIIFFVVNTDSKIVAFFLFLWKHVNIEYLLWWMYKDLNIAPHVSASIFIYSIVVLTVAIITAGIAKNKSDRIQIIWTYYSSKTTTKTFYSLVILNTNKRKCMMWGEILNKRRS